LISVDGDWPLFRDAGTNTVRPFELLRKHAAKPSSPVLEFGRTRLFAAMLDYDACGVTEQNDIPGLANQAVKAIDLLLSAADEFVVLLTKTAKLAKRQYVRRPSLFGIDAVLVSGTLPGGGYPFDTR
jgi:hypothetical protein